jgi:hypothetical protein
VKREIIREFFFKKKMRCEREIVEENFEKKKKQVRKKKTWK